MIKQKIIYASVSVIVLAMIISSYRNNRQMRKRAIGEVIAEVIWDETGPIDWGKLKEIDPRQNWEEIRLRTRKDD